MSVKIGFTVLAHADLHRTRQVVRYLVENGAAVAIHIDRKTTNALSLMLQHNLSDFENVIFVKRYNCDWGKWSLVEAQLEAARALMNRFPDLDYVYQISGSCLPIRPYEELEEFLSQNDKSVDYIESVAIGASNWVKSGLDEERLTLYHPFSWRSQRWLFNQSVELQRRFNISRKVPEEITPAFGSQWWCLTAKTLKKILTDPMQDEYQAFFRHTWIPDESYFQTLARKHSEHVDSRSLTFAHFDSQGRPVVLYDDHLETLETLNRFFARKVWAGANGLYNHFLNPDRIPRPPVRGRVKALVERIEFADGRRHEGRRGLVSQSRYTIRGNRIETACEHHVLIGYSSLLNNLKNWTKRESEKNYIGEIFADDERLFDQNIKTKKIYISGNKKVRCYNKSQFLMQTIWRYQDEAPVWSASLREVSPFLPSLLADGNCHVHILRNAWVIDLMKKNVTNIDNIREVARNSIKDELHFNDVSGGIDLTGRLEVVELDDILQNPFRLQSATFGDITVDDLKIDLEKLRNYLQFLSDNGVSLKGIDPSEIDELQNRKKSDRSHLRLVANKK